MSEFDPKDFPMDPGDRQLPATIALGAVVDRKVKEAVKTLVEQNGWPPEIMSDEGVEYLTFEDDEPHISSLGEADHITFDFVQGFAAYHGNKAVMQVNLYCDGSPYMFNEDLEKFSDAASSVEYHIVCFPELPPYIVSVNYDKRDLYKNWSNRLFDFHDAYTEAAQRGEMPPLRYLKEEEAESVLLAFNELDLVQLTDIEEMKQNVVALREQ